MKSGLSSYCLDCIKIYAKIQNDKRREHRRNFYIQTKYKISGYDYKTLFELQNGRCAICKELETSTMKGGLIKSLSVDHCHMTEEIRGLLCQRCNTALGQFRDDINILQEAIKYLEKTNGK